MRSLCFALAILASAATLLAADSRFLGTWKLNVQKSKFTPGSEIQSQTVKFEMAGESVRRTASGNDAQGKPIMQGGPGGTSLLWNGQDQPVNDPAAPGMTIALVKVNDHTVDATVKIQGKVINRDHTVISKDGSTMTSTQNGVNDKGEKIHLVEVFEKR